MSTSQRPSSSVKALGSKGRVPAGSALVLVAIGLVVFFVVGDRSSTTRAAPSVAVAPNGAQPVDAPETMTASLRAPEPPATEADRRASEAPSQEAASSDALPDAARDEARLHAFLPPELEVLSVSIPESLDRFEKASPTERLHQARELLAHSIAVIQCARGTGPIPPGMPGDKDLSHTGREGKWAFQVNHRTFHFQASDFPEYGEYIALLRSAYDDEMVLRDTTIELPEHLAEGVRLRAFEALSWL